MKIIHCADIHLDSPFTLSDPMLAEKRRHALRSAFSNLVLYAKTSGTQLFIISGDLFDKECVTKDTTLMLCREMASVPECKFVIAPGNHDPYNHKSAYSLVDFPDNVYIFKSQQMARFEFPDLHCRVYGYAFASDTYITRPLSNFTLPDDGFDGINILAAHGHFDTDYSYYAPITYEDLEHSGFDYAALGHIHRGSGNLQKCGKTYYAYSGCLEGRNFGETGIKGALVGEITKQGVDIKKMRVCLKHYEKVVVDITGSHDLSECSKTLVDACKDFDSDTILRVVLTGVTSPGFFCDVQMLQKLIPGITVAEVRDETLALLDTANLKNDNTVVGEFYRALEPKLFSEDDDERMVALGALRYGLRALYNMEIHLN